MEKFYLGIDIGTNSVGMACTDENYDILRAKGKDCWAVRLFDERETAENRRISRSNRRRVERRRQRLGFLQSLFAPYIEDETFFIRLNNSQYYADDKAKVLNCDKNTLFADVEYSDKDFHAQFPTIYHLRKKLQEERSSDLRLYYLALHHIVKYRGHFLSEGEVNDVRDINRLFEDLNATCADIFSDSESAPYFDTRYANDTKACLLNSTIGMKDRLAVLESYFGKDRKVKEIIKGICGATFSPKALFGENYKSEKSICLKKTTDAEFYSMQETYGDDFILLERMRALCSYVLFEKLLDGQPNVSSAMIKLYEDHKRDLKTLKKFLHENASKETYYAFFKSSKEKSNYANYIGYTKKGGDKIKAAQCKDEDFFASLEKLLIGLDDVRDERTRADILSKIKSGEFLPKILHADNGLFPHQVNEDELVKIVAKMVEFHPQTKDVASKILPVFLFRIPYYVGPLTGKYSWAVRGDEKITPWNFHEVVDMAKSSENFMRKMTNKCTYLHGEDVLPQSSIIYQKFNVLNQINKLRIDDAPISVPLKKQIFDELFMRRKNVSDKTILNFLAQKGYVSDSQKNQVKLGGKDGDIKANMSSYIRLKEILGDFADDDIAKGGEVCENIILWHTLNTDKNLVCDLILKNYGNIPAIKSHIKQLKGLTFQKFGRFSKKFLTEIRSDFERNSVGYSILDLLYETNKNLNEILFDQSYRFDELIRAENGEVSNEVGYDDVENLYVSPAVRRGIWQTVRMADEYVQAIGRVPNKIFIEFTRETPRNQKGKRSESRKNKLLAAYNGLQGYDDVSGELCSQDISDMRLRQERLYLYFRQLGRCMYSGERINLDELNADRYDVDHILPRSYIKDDSLDNKVLVLRSKNAQKRDLYPLPANFSSQQPFWKFLSERNLISDVTYKRLTRTEPLNEDDYNDFINRQKIVTDQSVKAAAELLKRKYPQAKIVYCRAKNVSDFRAKFNLYKCRDTNDLHHAKDAYLNIVVGNVYDTCFSTPMAIFYKNGDEWRTYNLKTMFSRDVKGAWDGNTISRVKAIYAKTSAAVTRYAYRAKGAFYDQTVYSHDDASITAPRKGRGALSNFSRYGGYKSQSTAYFAVVSSEDKKGRTRKTLEAIPILLHEKSKRDPNALKDYFNSLGYSKVEILLSQIKCKQLVLFNGMPVYLSGISSSRILCCNAVQLFTDNNTDEYIKALSDFVDRNAKDLDSMKDEHYVVKTNRMGENKLSIDRERNEKLYLSFCSKLQSKIYSGIDYCATFAKTLTDGRRTFERLTVAMQAKALLQILEFFKCNATLSDLTLIGGGAYCGKLSFNKDITDVDFRIINQSPCGLTQRERRV